MRSRLVCAADAERPQSTTRWSPVALHRASSLPHSCAIDSELMRKVIASVNDTIMRSNLSETGASPHIASRFV